MSLLLCFVVVISMISAPSVAHAMTLSELMNSDVNSWIDNSSSTANTWSTVDNSSTNYTVNKPQNYYTSVTSSVVDKSGNVTNYYRGGDTTNTKIVDSYNKTFNTIYNTTNNSTTNQYKANVKLENFLNQYTTNNVTTNNTYSANFKSWYYDNTTNNYNYNEFNKYDTTNNYLYYNQDNSRYYISIDNSTDEYYLVDVQYSPTFVTVNYTYNTTNINNEKVGDVTNVYYYELKDGRNSSTLTAAEVAGMDTGYDAANYELVTDDPNTLSLQHFDGDYTDSSSYNRAFYSQNRSTNYVDSGAFGKAVALPNGSAAGVTIPGLSSYDSLSFDFRVYFNDISSLGIYFGDKCIFENVPEGTRIWSGRDVYADNNTYIPTATRDLIFTSSGAVPFSKYSFNDVPSRYFYDYIFGSSETPFVNGRYYTLSEITSSFSKYEARYTFSDQLTSNVTRPSRYNSPGYNSESSVRYGWMNYTNANFVLVKNDLKKDFYAWVQKVGTSSSTRRYFEFRIRHYCDWEYSFTPSAKVVADFSYDSYKNQWVSMRVTISGGKLYYFVNGDLVGSGTFTKPSADKFYIKSFGNVYLDELRVTTGSLASTSTYNPSSAPYDTNKVLALPDNLTANTIYVQHNTKVSNLRIGGVRPSNPAVGFLYIPLYDDRTAAQPQLYDGSNWVDVTAMVHNGDTTVNVLGYKFSPIGDSPDIDMDAKPERPVKPGDNVDPESCTHDWIENVDEYVAPTCTLPGKKSYTCSKCEKQKAESIALLDHDWSVKVKVPNQYDENGEPISMGFTIFECLRCGEQYKSTDGTPPPALDVGNITVPPGSGSGDEGEEKEGFLAWLLRKAGELLGAVGEGIINFLQGVLDKLFDGLISLIDSVFANLAKLLDLFGSFGDALGVLWTWLPSEIMIVLVAGVSVFVLIALLKLVMK